MASNINGRNMGGVMKLDLSVSEENRQHALNVAAILRNNGYEKRAEEIEKMVAKKKGFIEVDK
jgi:hypothetical protein